MIFHSIVFSLGDPQKNEYVYMLALLINSLRKTGSYKIGEDTYYVMADAETLAVMQEMLPFLSVHFIEIPKPKDVYEGMTYKYMLFDFAEPSKDVVMYIDVDMICVRSCRLAIPEDRLYVFPEGNKHDDNYRGDSDCLLTFGAGFTAGFFVYRFGARVEETFDEILRKMASTTKRYYCLDQPHFNRALDYQVGCAGFLPGTFISFNGHTNAGVASFINLAGIPGDGPFHFRKALGLYLAYY